MLLSLVRHLLTPRAHSVKRPRSAPRRRASFRPGIESLEDRQVMSTLSPAAPVGEMGPYPAITRTNQPVQTPAETAALTALWHVLALTKNAVQAPWISQGFGQGEDAEALRHRPAAGTPGQAATAWGHIMTARPLIVQAVALFDEARHASGREQGPLVDRGNELLRQAGTLVRLAEQIWSVLWSEYIHRPTQPSRPEVPPTWQPNPWNPLDWLIPPAYGQEPVPQPQPQPQPPRTLNQQIVDFVKQNEGKGVGTGTCYALVERAFETVGAKIYPLPKSGNYIWGKSVANFTKKNRGAVKKLTPGDVLQFRNVKFVKKDGSWAQYGHHSAVVTNVQGNLVEIYEQHTSENGSGPRLYVTKRVLDFSALKQGTIWAYRAVPAR